MPQVPVTVHVYKIKRPTKDSKTANIKTINTRTWSAAQSCLSQLLLCLVVPQSCTQQVPSIMYKSKNRNIKEETKMDHKRSYIEKRVNKKTVQSDVVEPIDKVEQ